ncbi:hypothetical protein DVH24_014453 [Malus domestica]|uniref:Uncharacterized protein n=1 Tax=Malus domestica TaxID=3750 RepID=A0A498KK77_MALDO|nr:hypothetical protein DVH24_014453 [Malus domestica]
MVRIWALEDSKRRSRRLGVVEARASARLKGPPPTHIQFSTVATYIALPLLVDPQSHSSPDPPLPPPMKYNGTKCLVFRTESSFSSSAPSLL